MCLRGVTKMIVMQLHHIVVDFVPLRQNGNLQTRSELATTTTWQHQVGCCTPIMMINTLSPVLLWLWPGSCPLHCKAVWSCNCSGDQSGSLAIPAQWQPWLHFSSCNAALTKLGLRSRQTLAAAAHMYCE